jgi:AraC family transcriptional regulator
MVSGVVEATGSIGQAFSAPLWRESSMNLVPVLPRRPAGRTIQAITPLELERSEDGPFGGRMAAYLSRDNEQAVTTHTLRSPKLIATSLRCDWGLFGLSDPIPPERAFVVSVQLRELSFHELRLRGATVRSGHHAKGGVSAFDLEDDPRFFFPCSFHCLHFYLKRSALDELADEHHAKPIGTLCWPHGKIDETVSRLSLALIAAFEDPANTSKLFVDHVALALTTHFAYAYGGMRAAPRVRRPYLASWQKRRCEDLARHNLAKGLSLADIAKECEMPVSHFAHSFKQSTGESPYRWFLKRRVEAAKEMLISSELAIQEIAVACGFGEPSRFARAFCAVVGAAPEVWRRDRVRRSSNDGTIVYLRLAGRDNAGAAG